MQEEPSPSLILIDFDPSFHPHVHFRYESLLKRKFQMQQQGMIKYLEYRHAILTNGPVHYHPSELAIFTNALSNMFLPVEFMNDKLFMMEFMERHGYGLQYGSHDLQKDAQVIMEAYRKACRDEKNVQLCNRNNRELFVQHLQVFLPKESTQYQDLIMALSSTDQRAALNECTKVDNDREYAPKENVLPKTNDSLEEVLKQYTNPSDKQQRIEVLKILKQDGMALQYATEKFKQDFGTVKAAVRQNGNAFEYASRNVKRNKETVLFALNHGALFNWVDRELYNDRDVILKVAQQGQIVDFTHFRNDREIVLEVMKHHGKYLNNASDELRRDREVVLYAVKSHYSAFLYACHELKKDPEIALTAIAHLNTALNNNTMDISDLTWCEKEICSRMIRAKYDHPLKYTSQALLNDREFIWKAIEIDVGNFWDAHQYWNHDKDMILEVVKRRPFMLQTASKTLRNDKEVVLTAFMKDPWSLMLASPQLTEDQDIAMAALTCLPCKNDPWRLMSGKVKKDRDLLLKALTKNIRVMDYFSDEMKMDREFMLQCVAVTAEVMSIVPTSLQRDKTFMKEAIQRNGCVLKWVKGSIDPELELEAVKQNGFVLVNNYRDELFRARMEHCYVGCYLAHLHK